MCFLIHQLIFHSELLVFWPYAPDKPKVAPASLEKFGSGWARLITLNQKWLISSRDIDNQGILKCNQNLHRFQLNLMTRF